jgi:hypothetical protein
MRMHAGPPSRAPALLRSRRDERAGCGAARRRHPAHRRAVGAPHLLRPGACARRAPRPPRPRALSRGAPQVVLDLAGAVKELVENALDAGATVIEARARAGGCSRGACD